MSVLDNKLLRKAFGWSPLTMEANLIGLLIVVLIICAMVWVIFIRPGQEHRDAVIAQAQSKINAGQLQSGQEAINALSGQAAALDANRAATEEASIAIHQAEGANQPVSSSVNGAGLRAQCMRQLYRDTPRCRKLLKSGS